MEPRKLSALRPLLLAAALCSFSPGTASASIGDTGWPRITTTNGNRIEVFQPQVESWQTNCLRARAVVEVTLPDDSQPHIGVVWFTAATSVDTSRRLVTLDNFALDRVKFTAQTEQEANMMAVLRGALPRSSRTIALDRLLLASVAARHQARQNAGPLKHDPPIVVWTTNAVAALVLIDGNPVLRPVDGSPLMRVINTASLILFDPSGGTYYLFGNGQWFQSEGIAGPWQIAANPPADVTALTPASGNQAVAGATAESPVVFVSTQPAELLQTPGEPSYQTESGSGLMYVANTDSQLLYDAANSTAYLLLSGRWFASHPGLTGPWSYVAPKDLPPSFAQIAPSGPKGAVLASVPGTPRAAAAHVANALPQTATIQRRGASFHVQYDGAPRFQPINGTELQYAANASEAVILCQNRYYAVGNAVWFTSDAPTGPWAVAASVPDQIYTIPPSSPLYYVTFVYIGYADDNQVELAYTPGYTGSYDSDDDGGPVYGTGWYYTPWADTYYFGWGWTYGYSFQYRWWERSWLWRPAWNRVGNLYAVNPANVYDAWPRAADQADVREARAVEDRSLGYGYPTTYGRFAGATRAVPMAVPSRACLTSPYATAPATRHAATEYRGAEQQLRGIRVGSASSRDLYATADGTVYWRRNGDWYRANARGGWAYAAPAVGPRTSAYHPDTVSAYDRAAAYRTAPAQAVYRRMADARYLDSEYYARAAGERCCRSYRGRR